MPVYGRDKLTKENIEVYTTEEITELLDQINNKVNSMDLEYGSAVADLQNRMTPLENEVEDLNTAVSRLDTAVSSLNARVSALEN